MRKTLIRFGIEASMEFTIIFIPSFLETIFSGRSALRALNALRYDISTPVSDCSNTKLTTERNTIKKSSLLQLSFKQACLPRIKPIAMIFIRHSQMKRTLVKLSNKLSVDIAYLSSRPGSLMAKKSEFSPIKLNMNASNQVFSATLPRKIRTLLVSGMQQSEYPSMITSFTFFFLLLKTSFCLASISFSLIDFALKQLILVFDLSIFSSTMFLGEVKNGRSVSSASFSVINAFSVGIYMAPNFLSQPAFSST